MEFKVGQRYKVNGSGEHNNIIEITMVNSDTVCYKTISGKPSGRPSFEIGSPFSMNLMSVNNNETIVIYRKGNETIALDKSTGKKAVAKCSPQDKFDFYTGAKLALERLTGNVTFRLLCVTSEIPFCTKGKIYEFVNGVTTWDDTCESSEYSNYKDFVRHNVVFSRHFKELKDGDNPEEILKKYNTIKEGDKVKVINSGETYSNYVGWVERNIKYPHVRYIWDYGKSVCKGDIGKVIKIAPHGNDTGVMLAYVEIRGRCYIIGVEGLEKC